MPRIAIPLQDLALIGEKVHHNILNVVLPLIMGQALQYPWRPVPQDAIGEIRELTHRRRRIVTNVV
jgi:hypothetical protein